MMLSAFNSDGDYICICSGELISHVLWLDRVQTPKMMSLWYVEQIINVKAVL
jgi:hypothetical protein